MIHYKTVFLFDVDNTLLDHDRVTRDLRRYLESAIGAFSGCGRISPASAARV
jgi:FMN phosphatase YigB (HAD superfamily)